MQSRFTSPTKTASVRLQPNGLYVGIVTSSTDGKVYVEIPRLVPGFSFGPCLVASTSFAVSATTSIATSSGETVVTNVEHTYPETGQKVICGFLNNTLDEVIILGNIL